MKLLKTSTCVALLIAGMSVTSVQAREFAEIYTECGLGAMIAPNNDAVAAVTNVTWDLGTTAISSDITSPDTCQGGKEKTAAYIYEAYPSIERDLAKGKGEHLDALYSLASCEAQSRDSLTATMRSEMAEVVADEGYATQTRYEKAESLYSRFNSVAMGSCNIG